MSSKADLHRKAADVIEALTAAERGYWLSIEGGQFVIKMDPESEAVVLWEEENIQ